MHLLAEVSSRVPPAVPPTNGSLSPLPSLKKSLSFSFDEPAGQKRFFDDVVQSSPASSISGTSSEGDAEATCVVALVCDEDSVTQQYRMGLAAPVARHATGDINVATDDEGGSLDRTWDSDRRVVTASRSQGARSAHVEHTYFPPLPESNRHVCPYKMCVMSFSRRSHLERHMLTHTNTKPHVCHAPGCRKSFNRLEHLTRHEETVHSVATPGRLLCTVCKRTFKDDVRLSRHQLRMHHASLMITAGSAFMSVKQQ